MFDALRRNEATGAVELNLERCVKCMACIAACPFGCALVDETHDEVVKCDLCRGNPACARFCPTKALVYKRIA
jgi:Fe-S-cluster-containing dehydrogenase component